MSSKNLFFMLKELSVYIMFIACTRNASPTGERSAEGIFLLDVNTHSN